MATCTWPVLIARDRSASTCEASAWPHRADRGGAGARGGGAARGPAAARRHAPSRAAMAAQGACGGRRWCRRGVRAGDRARPAALVDVTPASRACNGIDARDLHSLRAWPVVFGAARATRALGDSCYRDTSPRMRSTPGWRSPVSHSMTQLHGVGPWRASGTSHDVHPEQESSHVRSHVHGRTHIGQLCAR